MSYSRIFLSSRFWLTASKQDLLYQVMCPLSTLFSLFPQFFSEQQKTGSLLPAFPSLFPFQLLSAPRPLRARRGADD